MYEYEPIVRYGGLMSYGPDMGELQDHVAGLIERILKRAKPAELPSAREDVSAYFGDACLPRDYSKTGRELRSKYRPDQHCAYLWRQCRGAWWMANLLIFTSAVRQDCLSGFSSFSSMFSREPITVVDYIRRRARCRCCQ